MTKNRENRIERTLEYVRDYQKWNGRTPSYREIMRACGQKSLSTVKEDIERLIGNGYLAPSSGESWRKLAIPENLSVKKSHVVPIVGACPCGNPITAIENIEDSVVLPDSIFGSGELFILKAVGKSMINCGIFDGDLMVVSKNREAGPGDVVVAMVNEDEATAKILSVKAGKYYLSPANDETDGEGNRLYCDIYPEKLSILGVVTRVIHTPGLV